MVSIASVDDLLAYLEGEPRQAEHAASMQAYLAQYGVEPRLRGA